MKVYLIRPSPQNIKINGDTYTLTSVIGDGAMSTVFDAKRYNSTNTNNGQSQQHEEVAAIKRLEKVTPFRMTMLAKEVRLLQLLGNKSPDDFIKVIDMGYGEKVVENKKCDNRLFKMRLGCSQKNKNQVQPTGFEPFLFDNLSIYVVMEKGISFYDKLIGRLVVGEAKRKAYFRQMVRGLHVMHSNRVVHTDVKPENFVVTPDGNLKIIDLGCSVLMLPNHVEVYGGRYGTRRYLAPEKRFTPTVTGFAGDIFSLGLILYRMAFGYFPSVSIHPRDTIPGRLVMSAHPNRDLVHLVNQMMEMDRTQRPTIHQVINHPYLTT